jgi:hypothetical protein
LAIPLGAAELRGGFALTPLDLEGDSIVLAASRRKAALVFLGSGAFVTIGAFLVASGESGGWFPLAFFGFCLIVSIVLLFPGSTTLTIDRDGIHMKHMFRLTHIRWSDVDSFYVGSIRTGVSSTKMIGIKYSDSYQGQKAGRNISSALTGMEGGIPNQYQASAEELCELLNTAKRRFSSVA